MKYGSCVGRSQAAELAFGFPRAGVCAVLCRSSLANTIDRLELLRGAAGGTPFRLRTLGDLAEVVALVRSRAETAVELELLTSAAQKQAFAALDAFAGGGPAVSLTLASGELQEFDDAWAGSSLSRFEMRFKDRLMAVGLTSNHATLICAALDEMISNAQEHADAPCRSLATFEVTDRWWSFSVTDFGRGIPNRLRQNPEHHALRDPDAIATALNHGVSTYREPGRGTGFSQVFRALADRSAKVRIRAGGGLVELEGIVEGTGTLSRIAKSARVGTHVRAGAMLLPSASQPTRAPTR